MKRPNNLPVLACGCSRRGMLQAVGGGILGMVMASAVGCTQTGSALSAGSVTTCGADHCLDLADASNSALVTVGGALLIDTAGDTIMVIRTSETAVTALSAICTHAGCSMDYDATGHQLTCPCHGSVFSEDGQVVRGPARRAVHVYVATLANGIITLVA